MALQLRRLGITRIRPLASGLIGWRDRGFALEPLASPATAAAGE